MSRLPKLPDAEFQNPSFYTADGFNAAYNVLGTPSHPWSQVPTTEDAAERTPVLWHREGHDKQDQFGLYWRDPTLYYGRPGTLLRKPRVILSSEIAGTGIAAWASSNAAFLDEHNIHVGVWPLHDGNTLQTITEHLPWMSVTTEPGPAYDWARGDSIDPDLFVGGELLILVQANALNYWQKNPSGQVRFTDTSYEAVDGTGGVAISVTRNAAPAGNEPYFGEITVEYATTAGTAIEGVDYDETSGILYWDHQDGADKVFHVPVYAGASAGGTITITLSNASPDTSITGTNPVTLTINNGTGQTPVSPIPPPPPTVPPAGVNLTELNSAAFNADAAACVAAQAKFDNFRAIVWTPDLLPSPTEKAQRETAFNAALGAGNGWVWRDDILSTADLYDELLTLAEDFFGV